MIETSAETSCPSDAKIRLPWFVKVSPAFYDDRCDVGFGWEGWATGDDDAVTQALEECHEVNERDPEFHDEDVDPRRAKVHVAEIDFRQFAGPLLHWAQATGNVEEPIWKAVQAAVKAASLAVVPFELTKEW